MKKLYVSSKKSKKAVMGISDRELIEKFDARIELIQALIPIGLDVVGEQLQNEVRALVGERYTREKNNPSLSRWGTQGGSVYLRDQKVKIKIPRVRNLASREEILLQSYARLQAPSQHDELLFNKVLKGLSCADYRSCAENIPGALGISKSNVSTRFIRASGKKLQALQERRLDDLDIVAVLIDGKHFGNDEMVIAVGIDMGGNKHFLGLVQTGSENTLVCTAFLKGLIERGLKYTQGILFCVDGAKGFHKAINAVFGEHAKIQRCQWHKRENVVGYLPKSNQVVFREKLQKAYEKPTYVEAKDALLKIRKELITINGDAVGSLDEGFEETLTLHKLGVFVEVGVSLKTTNIIESINSQLGQRTDKVDNWKNSNQKHRWIASALLEIEPRLNRIKGHEHLGKLREALKPKEIVVQERRAA